MMNKTRTKQEMSRKLNGLLNLNVDWAALKRSDLEQVHRFFFQEMSLPRALNLNKASLRLKLEKMPLVQILREQVRIVRQDCEKQAVHQSAVIPPPHPPMSLQQPPSSLQSPSLQQKKQVPDYVC